jgi:hypothetical protein
VEETSLSHWKISSNRFPNTSAMRNAVSSVGEYFPASIAAMVCRVKPMRSPSSACVISFDKKRINRRLFRSRFLAIQASTVHRDDQSMSYDFSDDDRQHSGMKNLPS